MDPAKSKILVVDDEPDIVDVLREFLARKGYDVLDALSGEEALNILDREKADLVLLDLMLPGLKGPEAARIIKKKHPAIKIVTLTAHPDMGESLLHENILDGVFIKPIRMQELLKRLLDILGREEKEPLEHKPEQPPVPEQPAETRAFFITAKLLFVESSAEVYDLLETHFRQLSKKGEHYLPEVAGSEEQIKEKLRQFNPDILLVNASFLRKEGRDVILDALTKSSQCKEVLIYNIDDINSLDEKRLRRLTENVELTCFLRGLL